MEPITIEDQISISEQNVKIMEERVSLHLFKDDPTDAEIVEWMRARDTYKEIVKSLQWIKNNHVVTDETALANKLETKLNVEFRDYFDWKGFLNTDLITEEYLDEGKLTESACTRLLIKFSTS